MTILSAQSIRKRGELLTPFVDRTEFRMTNGAVLTGGLTHAGYDVHLVLADKNMHWIEPGEFLLAATVERFKMPNDLIGLVHDKSSMARRGIALQNTVIEPGWEGYLTLEITNHGPDGMYLETGMPIAQVIFHLLDEPTDAPYQGKYQNQEFGPQRAR